jgi:hypothetical protein
LVSSQPVKSRKTLPILVVVTLVALAGVTAVRTVLTSGPAAVAQMNGDERVLLAKLATLRKGMSLAEVVAVLGEPDDAGPLGLRPKWRVGANPLNGVAVYFLSDGAQRIDWLSFGRFNYERTL